MNPTAVNLSIDLASLFVEPTELDGDPVDLRTAMRKAVVAAAADKLVAGFDADTLHEMREEIHRVRNELVRERLVIEVTAAMELPIQRTTRWGEKIGDPLTVLELIRMELETFLNDTGVRSNRISSGDKPQNLAELVQTVSRQVIAGPLAKQVEAARQEVSKRVQSILTEAITAQLAKPR